MDSNSKDAEALRARINKSDYLSELKNEKPTEQFSAPSKKTSSDKSPEIRRPISKVKKAISKQLLEIQQKTTQLTIHTEVDLKIALELKEKYEKSFFKSYETELSLRSFFIKASALALLDHPIINSYIDDDEIVERQNCDIAISINDNDEVFTPTIKKAENLSFGEIESKLKEFSIKKKNNSLEINDLQGAGFTITDNSSLGAFLTSSIITNFQSAALAIHRVNERVVAVENDLEVHPIMMVSLTYDHQIIDNKQAIIFLEEIRKNLEDPARMLLGIPS